MGTRSITIFMDDDKELVRIYRQYDGYPDGHGVELARACNKKLTNGFGQGQTALTHANGMGCLAAQAICALKQGEIGNVYIEAANESIGPWIDYIYVVRADDEYGKKPIIECTANRAGAPFAVQDPSAIVFEGTPAEWIKKFSANSSKKKAA